MRRVSQNRALSCSSDEKGQQERKKKMKRASICVSWLLMLLIVLLGTAFPKTINYWVYYPFDSHCRAVPDSTSPQWYRMNFNDSGWPYAREINDIGEFPVLTPVDECCSTGYLRGELNFTYRDIAASQITAVYVWNVGKHRL